MGPQYLKSLSDGLPAEARKRSTCPPADTHTTETSTRRAQQNGRRRLAYLQSADPGGRRRPMAHGYDNTQAPHINLFVASAVAPGVTRTPNLPVEYLGRIHMWTTPPADNPLVGAGKSAGRKPAFLHRRLSADETTVILDGVVVGGVRLECRGR